MAKRLIYIIEDDSAVANALSFLLRATGYSVIVYQSGLHFLDDVPDYPEGCVLTDVRMPGLNGIELTAQLRGLGLGMPVIVMSGHADAALSSFALRAGAVDFITKPFDDDILLEALEKVCAENQPVAH